MAKTRNRDHILVLQAAVHSNKTVSKQVGVSLKTEYDVIKGYKRSGSTSTKPSPGRKRSVGTKRSVDIVRKVVSWTPRRSIRKMAKDLQVSGTMISRIVKDCLCLMLYKMHVDIWFWKRQRRIDWIRLKTYFRRCSAPMKRSLTGQMRISSLWSQGWTFRMTGSWKPVLPGSISQFEPLFAARNLQRS